MNRLPPWTTGTYITCGADHQYITYEGEGPYPLCTERASRRADNGYLCSVQKTLRDARAADQGVISDLKESTEILRDRLHAAWDDRDRMAARSIADRAQRDEEITRLKSQLGYVKADRTVMRKAAQVVIDDLAKRLNGAVETNRQLTSTVVKLQKDHQVARDVNSLHRRCLGHLGRELDQTKKQLRVAEGALRDGAGLIYLTPRETS